MRVFSLTHAQMNSNSVACLFVDAYASFDVWSLSNAVEEQSVGWRENALMRANYAQI